MNSAPLSILARPAWNVPSSLQGNVRIHAYKLWRFYYSPRTELGVQLYVKAVVHEAIRLGNLLKFTKQVSALKPALPFP